jgi:hypothetical protein
MNISPKMIDVINLILGWSAYIDAFFDTFEYNNQFNTYNLVLYLESILFVGKKG